MLYVSSNIASIASQTITADPKKQSAPFSYGLGVTDPAKVPTFAKLLPAYENNGQISASTVQGDLSMLQAAQESIDQIKAVPTDGFFRDWTCMISVQTVLINSADLDLLSKIPEQLMTLRKWVFAGGQLVVLDAGENFGKRGKILNKLLGQPVRQAEWFQPSDEMKAVKGFAVRNAWNMQTGANQVTSITDLPLKPRLPCKSFENQDLIMTPIMQGKLILANSDMTKGTSKQWQLLHNWLRSDDTITSLVGHNCHKGAFQQAFRIPGIGNPPVLAFQLLIGLYVLVIGPALYFFLNSTGRLYLLLVTIPLFSLGAVATLFTYGIVSDGFSTRGRLQSVSYVDQKLQTAVTHSRYVYYSGVRPSANRFPADAFASNSRSTSSGSCRVVRAKDQQLLSGGHIKARSPFQLTSLQSSTCESRLMFSPNQTGASGLISNAYPNRILFAIVYTQDGWYTASDIDSGASKDAQMTEYRNVKTTLNKYLTKIKVDPYYLSGRFRSRYEIQNDHDNWGMSNDVISGLRSGYLQGELMPENSYLLVLESNELMSNPQPTADLGENQLHVVLGKW
jgi:hypothetical protein